MVKIIELSQEKEDFFMKYVMIFHANLNYAYLNPDKYEFVIRNSYELTFDTMAENFPNTKYVFEASGYTIEQMALLTPDVLEKLKKAIANGTCEFMGSPYAHPMLPNFPQEDGTWAIKFSNDIFKKYLGITPKSFWNPECGWRNYVPQQAIDNGFRNIIGDFESYSRSCYKDGTPVRPEIYKEEHSDEVAFYSFGFKYDLEGDERAIHFPINKIEGYEDDAEYIGTNGWFRLKYQNKPDNVFEKTPDSKEKLIRLVKEVEKLGGFVTYDDACNLQPLEETVNIDDNMAWHGGLASTWASTPMARILRPWQDLILQKADSLLDGGNEEEKKNAYHAKILIEKSRNLDSVALSSDKVLYPAEYTIRANMLIEARRLVGGVVLETV